MSNKTNQGRAARKLVQEAKEKGIELGYNQALDSIRKSQGVAKREVEKNPVQVPLPEICWADEDGDFLLSDGSLGNPGCDECGTYDAVVFYDGEYLCASGAAEKGLGWACDECENVIVSEGAVSRQHQEWCSLHANNVN